MRRIFIQTEHLTKWYGLVIGVNDVNISLEEGIHGLLGPNGAGKSTLLRLLTGELRPSDGRIRVLGESPRSPRLYRRMGYSPEQDAFYGFLSALEFVQFLTQMYGFSRREARKRAGEAIELVGLAQDMHRKISTFSKGMRQRIKIAQAIAHDPEILILDEPFGGTDPLIRHHLIKLLKEFAPRGKFILISSHILHEIEAMTDQVILIFRGKIRAVGNVHELREAMDEFPHHIRIKSNRPRKLLQAVLGMEDVVGVNLDLQGNVHVQTRNPSAFYQLLPQILYRENIRAFEIFSEDDTLQSLFNYLTQSF
jgi:ABC-2 type transport system ATP-binding protein